MFKKILKRALADAMVNGYRSHKPWKRSKYRGGYGHGYGSYGDDRYRHDPYSHDPYRHDPYRQGSYGQGPGGYGHGPSGYGHGGYRRSSGLKGFLIDMVMRWLSRRH